MRNTDPVKLTHAAIRSYYFQKGNNEDDWQIVDNHPRLFNQVWREMLGLKKDSTPPSKIWR